MEDYSYRSYKRTVVHGKYILALCFIRSINAQSFDWKR